MVSIQFVKIVVTRKKVYNTMGEIYQIKNDFNNKVYIGKTVKNTTIRKAQHLAQLHDGTAIQN